MSAGSGGSLSAEDVVPVSEGRAVVADKVLVVIVVVISTGPEREKVVQRPGELVTRVRVDSLEESQDDPSDDGDEVDIAKEVRPEKWRADSAETGDGNLDRVGVFSSEAKGCSVLVMLLVNVLVERANVKSAVEPVVP